MACFLLPKLLFHDLESIVARFWWQTNYGRKDNHWCEWSMLYELKDNDGLGFQNLAIFNVALLAK